jgi:hypothetical protein
MKARTFRSYLVVFSLAFLGYFLSSGPVSSWNSFTPQYVYLAYSFLHAKLHLIEVPPDTYDLIFYNGYWFVPGAVAPALVLLPFVAIWGLNVSDILFGIVVGALNVLAIYDLLGRLKPQAGFPHEIGENTRNWLTLLFAAGTAHWYIASMGSVWFNAQVLGVTFMILFVRETLCGNRGWLAGIWLGLAILSRPPVLFSALFYVAYVVLQTWNWRLVLQKVIPFSLAWAAAVVGLLIYNYLRFHHPLDFGYEYVQGSRAIVAAFAKYGGFNVHFFPCNFYVSMFGTPDVNGHMAFGFTKYCAYLLRVHHDTTGLPVAVNPIGMSIFFVTPAFVYAFKASLRKPLIIAAWVGLLPVMIPLWLYHNTGSTQYGFRYILDGIVFLMILVAAGMQGKLRFLEKLVIGASLLSNLVGMIWMAGQGMILLNWLNFIRTAFGIGG